ncbi:hypothetical protein BaRGS_00023783, partial [Batillaria attramentaria]
MKAVSERNTCVLKATCTILRDQTGRRGFTSRAVTLDLSELGKCCLGAFFSFSNRVTQSTRAADSAIVLLVADDHVELTSARTGGGPFGFSHSTHGNKPSVPPMPTPCLDARYVYSASETSACQLPEATLDLCLISIVSSEFIWCKCDQQMEDEDDTTAFPVVKESGDKLIETGINTLQRTLLLKKEVEACLSGKQAGKYKKFEDYLMRVIEAMPEGTAFQLVRLVVYCKESAGGKTSLCIAMCQPLLEELKQELESLKQEHDKQKVSDSSTTGQ